MTCEYVHPQVDNVRPEFQVDVLYEDVSGNHAVDTVEEAIEVYMRAFRAKFQSRLGPRKRESNLRRFVKYLKSCGHSLRIDELAVTDGQDFLDQLVNARDGSPLSREKKKQYRSALRSFSRFLADSGIIQDGIFFVLKVE